VCSRLVHLAGTPHHTLETRHSTCHGRRPSCLHSMGLHSRVAIPHKPEAIGSKAAESWDEIFGGDQTDRAHIGGVCEVALLHQLTDQHNR
jgi:hypothetical protein